MPRIDQSRAIRAEAVRVAAVLGELMSAEGTLKRYRAVIDGVVDVERAVRRALELRNTRDRLEEALKRSSEGWRFAVFGALAMIERLRPDVRGRLRSVFADDPNQLYLH